MTAPVNIIAVLRTSPESIAAKRQNLSTKEKPGAYYASLHEFKKRISSLKLPNNWQISQKQNHIFQKSKSYEISSKDIYVGEDLEFIIHVFFCCVPLDLEIYTKFKKAMKNITLSNLIEVISYYNICSEIKGDQAKKRQPFVIQYQKLFFYRFYFSFINTNAM